MDILTRNGVIHMVNQVNFPPVSVDRDVVTNMAIVPELSSLSHLLQGEEFSELRGLLTSGDNAITFFAMSNEAIAAVAGEVLNWDNLMAYSTHMGYVLTEHVGAIQTIESLLTDQVNLHGNGQASFPLSIILFFYQP